MWTGCLLIAALACAGCLSRPGQPAGVAAKTGSSGLDSALAARYLAEAATLCEREGGRRWGISLCGPIVIAEPNSKLIVTNQPAPSAPRPAVLGYANAAIRWGETRWTMLVWQHLAVAADDERRILMLHELFHRVQPQLGLLLPEPDNSHLDTFAGRYWLQLEWRALGRALGSSKSGGLPAIRDALTFRSARHRELPGAERNEQVLMINEGLPQYTGTVAAAIGSRSRTAANVAAQLVRSAESESYVRTFAYGSGAAYGLLLDAWSPGWTRRLKSSDDLALLLQRATGLPIPNPSDAERVAARYDDGELRAAELRRDADRQVRIADYRKRFVDGPVVSVPRGRSASFVTNGITPIPGAGTIYPTYRSTAEWGQLEAEHVLISDDGVSLRLPAPTSTEGPTLRGTGWKLELQEGWTLRKGSRAGDFEVVRR